MLNGQSMDGVLSLIRSLAQEEDVFLPTEEEMRDQQVVEMAVEEPNPAGPSSPAPEVQQRIALPSKQAEAVVKPVDTPAEVAAVTRPVQPIEVTEAQLGQRFEVRPAETTARPSEGMRPVESFDPPRLAAAMATATLHDRINIPQTEVGTREVNDTVDVTPSIRISHHIPEAFPVNPQILWGVIDRDADLPDMSMDSHGVPEIQLPPPVPSVSTEELVSRAYQHDDVLSLPSDRNVFS